MSLNLIAMMDLDNAIGKDEDIYVYNIPKHFKRYNAITKSEVVVVGRKTFENMNYDDLKRRKVYVLTMDKSYEPSDKLPNANAIYSEQDVMNLATGKDVYVIGGSELFFQFIDFADRMFITHVHKKNFDVNRHFPDFTAKDWKLVSKQKHSEEEGNDPAFTFAEYKRKEGK